MVAREKAATQSAPVLCGVFECGQKDESDNGRPYRSHQARRRAVRSEQLAKSVLVVSLTQERTGRLKVETEAERV